MSYGVRWVSPDGKTGHWTAPFATRQEAEEHAALRQMANGLSYTVEEIGLSPIEAKPQPRTTMSYRVRYTMPDGRTGHWMRNYATREEAQKAIDDRHGDTGLAYAVEEVSEPGSTAAHHVEILRARVKELEALVEERGKAVTHAHVANHAMHRDLALALKIGDAMRESMRTGKWRFGIDLSMANSATSGWDRWKTSLAKAPSVPVGASEAPGEGGDSDRRRLETLERWLRSKEDVSIVWMENRCLALNETGLAVEWGWSLAALADKLAEKEGKP